MFLNFANPDMVGHTGDYNAIIKAVEKAEHAQKVVEAGLKNDYAFLIIADSGNAVSINLDGHKYIHSTNLVPCLY